MSFLINRENFSGYVPMLRIELIGHFSIDGNMQYHDNLSQLKYYIPPADPNNVCYDLNINFESTRYKPTSHIKLDDVLRWVSDNFSRIERPLSGQKERWLDIDFICHRGTLKPLLCSPYKNSDGWIIRASKYRGTIYLCEFYTDEKENQHINQTTKNKQINSWGFKFEQYMVADQPSNEPNPSVPLNECEAFHCMFKTEFDGHSLLYAAEIDGISSQQPIKDTLVGKKIDVIELKTFKIYNESGDIYGAIAPERALAWWSQNYLGGVKKLICGLRDGSTVKMIKEYSTDDLPKFSKRHCDLYKCKMFCKIFLDNVKRIVTKDYNECMYKFYWNPSARNIINYNEEDPNNEMHFLKSWFIDKTSWTKQKM